MSQIDPNTGEVLEDTSQVQKQLEVLLDFKAQLDLIQIEQQDMIDSVLTPEILAEVDDIRAEFGDKIAEVRKKIAAMEKVIKQECVNHGATIKVEGAMVVYSKGRSGGWDTSGLQGYAVNNPEILQFKKKDGKPSASLRFG